jgi:ubiquinone/menaquinone biosynthesis C-methylase UbiE
MSKWLVKAILQRSFSISKNPEKINRFFQKYITGKDKLNEEKFSNKILHATDHLDYFKQHSTLHLSEIKTMELGTGQFPIVPIFYFLHGINDIVSIDVINFMTLDRIETCLQFFVQYKNQFPEKFKAILPERWQTLLDILANIKSFPTTAEVLKIFKTDIYIADARSTNYDDNIFDFITSNNTFEHIYPNILTPILAEFQRILKPNGVMSHFIDMTDHFAHFDKSITVYNFLKFSDRFWHNIDNDILPQSRLRYKDYLSIYNQQSIPIIDTKIWEHDSSKLEGIKLNKKYREYSKEELAIVHVYIVSSK